RLRRRRDRARQLVLRRGLRRQEHRLREPPSAADRLLERVGALGRRRWAEQAAHLVDEGRARLGGAVLVAGAVGGGEALAGAGDAGVEEVALVGVLVAPRIEPDQLALRLGEEGVPTPAAWELAVLEGADHDVVESPGSQLLGARDPHPSVDRPAPGAE